MYYFMIEHDRKKFSLIFAASENKFLKTKSIYKSQTTYFTYKRLMIDHKSVFDSLSMIGFHHHHHY